MNFGARVRFCRYQPAAVLRVSGEDALSFLQGQFTQDLKGGENGGVAYGLWLNQKGKVIADSFVARGRDGDFWVVSYFSSAAVIRERLESYVIADDVTIEDVTADWEGVVLSGEGAGAVLVRIVGAEPGTAGNALVRGQDLVWRGRRMKGQSWEWLWRKEQAPELTGVDEMSTDQLERSRIEAEIAAVPRDVGLADLPNEAGLEDVAISYTKGCYLGQEVMARLKAMGQVRRRLVKVAGAGDAEMLPTLPAGVFNGEKRVGEMRSAVRTETGWIGMAMVSLLGLEPGLRLSLSPGGVAEVSVEISKS